MATTPPVVHVSWLKKVGHAIGKVLGFISNDAQKLAQIAVPVAEALLPQFTPEIEAAYGLVVKIAKQAVVTESLTTGIGQAVTGQDKLNAVLSNVGPEIDAWIAANFPGAAQVSAVGKSGLVSAIVGILNELEGHAAPVVPPAA